MTQAERQKLVLKIATTQQVKSIEQMRIYVAMDGPLVSRATIVRDMAACQLFKIGGYYQVAYEDLVKSTTGIHLVGGFS